jgi:hypothetical protein
MHFDLLHILNHGTNQSIMTATETPEAFLLLSDCVFQPWVHNALPAAKALMHRIATQDYYAIVARKILFTDPPIDLLSQVTWRYLMQNATPDARLNSKNLFLAVCRYDLGSGVHDPLQNKVFYRSSQYGEVECYKSAESSSCFYDEKRHTAEYLVRLYTKIPPETVTISHWKSLCDAFHQVLSE